MRRYRALVRAVLVGLVSSAIGLAFVQMVIRQERDAARGAAADAIRSQAFALEKGVDRVFAAITPLATLLRREGSIGEFADLAVEIEAEAGLAALIVAGEDRLLSVHPPQYPDGEQALEALAQATEEGDAGTRLVGPLRLAVGKMIFLASIPIENVAGSGSRGQVIAVVHLADWLRRANLDTLRDSGYAYRLAALDAGDRRPRTFARSTELALESPIEEPVGVPGGEWLLALAPADGWPGWRSRRLEILIAGILSLLAALLTYDLVRKPERLRQQMDARDRHLNRTRHELSQEIRLREQSQARQIWEELDRLSRMVMAAAVDAEDPASLDVVEQQIEAALAVARITFRPGEIAAAVARLEEQGLLRLEPSRELGLSESGLLALPELRRPLAEIARESLDRVGPYLLGERLGGGGMGEVFAGTHSETGAVVAVKLLYPQTLTDPLLRRRFEREAEIVAGLDDPAIVKLLDSGDHRGRLYMVMELINGETLSEVLRRGMAPSRALVFFSDIAHALASLHAAEVIHRDLKPSNVMVTPEGRCVLLDFGVARDIAAVTLTQTEKVFGTLPYIAPERLRGDRGTASVDIWAAGLVLYEMLFAKLPWKDPGELTVIQEILKFERLALEPIQRHAGEGIARLLAEMLRPEPEQRIANGPDLLARMHDLFPGDPADQATATETRPSPEPEEDLDSNPPTVPLPRGSKPWQADDQE